MKKKLSVSHQVASEIDTVFQLPSPVKTVLKRPLFFKQKKLKTIKIV